MRTYRNRLVVHAWTGTVTPSLAAVHHDPRESRLTRTLVVFGVLLVVFAVVTLLVIRRRRYVRALRDRGWTFESTPQLGGVLEHQAPPFGLGFERGVDESVSGTTSTGVPFHAFEYDYSDGAPSFHERLVSLRLRRALPDLFVSDGQPREGVELPVTEVVPGWQVRAWDLDYARTVLAGPVHAALERFRSQAGGLDVSIDGRHVVAVGAPKNPDDLYAFLEALSPVASAVDAADLDRYEVPAPAPRYGCYGRPDWELVERDDSLIQKYDLTTEGHHHRTERIVRSPNDGLALEAFVHRWQTTHTQTYTDSDGKSGTRRVTQDHDETVTAVQLPFPLPQLSVNAGWGGERVRFELEEFNDRFAVRTSSPKFAFDVIHPRMMEFLMGTHVPDLEIDGHWIRFLESRHDLRLIGACADFSHEFLSRVPQFVWRDLGVSPPTFRTAGLPSGR